MANDTECSSCGGSGAVEVDRADRRGEHYSETVTCPDCGGDGDRFDDSEGDDFGGEVPTEAGCVQAWLAEVA